MTATAAVLGGLGLVSTTGADDHQRSFVVEQDGECLPVVPLSGDEPVEAFYDWGRDVLSWSSEGTRELQRSETSLLFLYRGPIGLSLVVIHDRIDDGTPGGVASFTVEGVPDDAEWAVKDDLYEASTNVDQWGVDGTVLEANETTVTDDVPEIDDNGTVADTNETTSEGDNATAYDARTDEIDWWWTEGRTDGGALRGLAVDDLEVAIDAAFGDEADLAEKPNEGEITTWTLLSGDVDDPDRTELDPESTLTLRTGTCEGDGEAAGTVTEEDGDGNATEDGDDEQDDEAEDDGDQAEAEDDGDQAA